VMIAKKDVHKPKHPELADKHGQCSLSSLKTTWSNNLPRDIFTSTLLRRVSSISMVPPTCHPAPQPSQDRHQQNHKRWSQQRHMQSAMPLVLTWKLRLGLGQQLNFSLEADLVMDVVNHLNKIRGDSFVLN
jgi:hypothetical protein